jgi:hypothetical protein
LLFRIGREHDIEIDFSQRQYDANRSQCGCGFETVTGSEQLGTTWLAEKYVYAGSCLRNHNVFLHGIAVGVSIKLSATIVSLGGWGRNFEDERWIECCLVRGISIIELRRTTDDLAIGIGVGGVISDTDAKIGRVEAARLAAKAAANLSTDISNNQPVVFGAPGHGHDLTTRGENLMAPILQLYR